MQVDRGSEKRLLMHLGCSSSAKTTHRRKKKKKKKEEGGGGRRMDERINRRVESRTEVDQRSKNHYAVGRDDNEATITSNFEKRSL